MTAIGGSIESVSIKSRSFSVAADASSARQLGGKKAEVLPNGDATARVTLTAYSWVLPDLSIVTDDSKLDQEFLQSIVNAGEFVPVTITYASGEIYQGTGIPTGDVATESNDPVTKITLSGSGELTPQ